MDGQWHTFRGLMDMNTNDRKRDELAADAILEASHNVRRDLFAAAALTGLLARNDNDPRTTQREFAAEAWELADAMLLTDADGDRYVTAESVDHDAETVVYGAAHAAADAGPESGCDLTSAGLSGPGG